MSHPATYTPKSRSFKARPGTGRSARRSPVAPRSRWFRRKAAAAAGEAYGVLSVWERRATSAILLLVGVELLQALVR
jgi:hypothetical protein